MTPMILAIDPGKKGGAALVCDGRVLRWWAWRPRAAGGYVVTCSDGLDATAGGMYGVGRMLCPDCGGVLVVEALHVRSGIPSADIVALSYEAGKLAAGVLSSGRWSEGPRPQAPEWASVCGGAGKRARDMTTTAVHYARRELAWDVPCTRDAAGSYESAGAVHEAAVMAVWAAARL